MSYSRFRKKAAQQQREGWRTWCQTNAQLIRACGVPESVFSDEHHWRQFLEISDDYPVDFDHRSLSLEQKVSLLRLINQRPIDCSTPVAGVMISDVLDAFEPRL